jgi:predicted nicotinamide N-methyase
MGIGGTIWDAALVLISFLEKNREQIFGRPGMRVLELGSGTGVLGLAAAKIGGENIAQVCITDIGQHLDLINRNLELNSELTEKVSVCNLDWFAPESLGSFDVILGSDLTYAPQLYRPLMETIDMHYSESTLLLMSREIRKEEDAEYYKVS